MNDFLVTPPFLRIALWDAKETMHLHIARISFFLRLNCFCIQRVSKNKLGPIKNCPWCKVGQIRCWDTMYNFGGFTSLGAILDILNYASIL